MTKYNTGNPIGSADPRDLYDNATVIDRYANSDAATTSDRLGVSRRTLAGMENEFSDDQTRREDEFDTAQDGRQAQFTQLMISGGYEFVGDYAAGIELTAYKQVVRDGGEFWRPAADTDLPYTTTGAGLPEGGAFVNIGDGLLRQDLVQPVATFNNVQDMKDAAGLDVGRKVRTLGYYAPGDGGGNDYEIVAAGTGTDDGGSFIDLSGSGLQAKGLFGSAVNVKQFGAVGDGVADDVTSFNSAIIEPYLKINNGNYKISSSINFKSAATQLYGDRIPTVGREGRNTNIIADFAGDAAINIVNSNCALSGFSLDRDASAGPNIGINISQNESAVTPSRDAAISGMQFLFFPTVLRLVGRGLTFSGNEVAGANVVVELDWLDGFEDSRENTHGTQGGFRNFIISNNRLHTVQEALVRNTGSNRKWISAIHVSDNIFDIGGRLFKGVLRRGQLVNNTINLARAGEIGIDLWGDSREYIIDNFSFSGAFKPEGEYEMIRSLPNYALVLRGNQENGDIGSISVNWIARQAVRIESDAVLKNITIDKLVVNDPCLSNPDFGVVANVTGATGEIRIKEMVVNTTDVPTSPIPLFIGNTGVTYILDSIPDYDESKFTLGTGGRMYAPFTGTVDTNGNLITGKNFLTTEKLGTGVYKITHNFSVASVNETIVTSSCISSNFRNSTITARDTNSFTIATTDNNGAAADSVVSFSFTTVRN